MRSLTPTTEVSCTGDLKAANAIIAAGGRLKIVDFGLARRIEHPEPDITTLVQESAAQLAMVGTPYAMAPEQVAWRGRRHSVGCVALGVLLFEMLVGGRPFGAKTVAELFSSILRDPPAALSAPRSRSAPRNRPECLAKNPSQRYQRAADVRLVLELTASGLLKGDRTPSEYGGGGWRSAAASADPRDSASRRLRGPRQRARAAWTYLAGGQERTPPAACCWAVTRGLGKTRLSLNFAAGCADERATVLVGTQ